MEKVGFINTQQQDLFIRPMQQSEEKVSFGQTEPAVAKVEEKLFGKDTEKQNGKDTENQFGKVLIKQIMQLPKAFEEVATAVELAAKEKYMDRRNVAQKRFGGRGNFVDVTV